MVNGSEFGEIRPIVAWGSDTPKAQDRGPGTLPERTVFVPPSELRGSLLQQAQRSGIFTFVGTPFVIPGREGVGPVVPITVRAAQAEVIERFTRDNVVFQ